MSGNKPKSNPFFDDEDDFGNGSNWDRSGIGSYGEAEARLERIMEQKRASQNRQLDSCNRALKSIYESEQIGNATAEELLHQGEQLDNIERKTDQINQSLTVSQRHINHVKSIFGGIKNWFTKPKAEPEAPKPEDRPRQLRNAVSNANAEADMPRAASNSSHPGLRVRDLDTAGFGDTPPIQTRVNDDPYEEEFQNYLGEMSSGISRLKGLGLGLQDEIVQQNDQLDRINSKVDKGNLKIEGQNTQIRKILR